MTRSITRLVVACVALVVASGIPVQAGDLALVVIPYPGTDGTLYNIGLDDASYDGVAKLPRPVDALAYDGHGVLYGIDAVADVLLEIQPATGEAMVIGPLGVDADTWFVDLAFDDAGGLWMVTNGYQEGLGIFQVDRTSGDARFFMGLAERFLGGIVALDGLLYVAGNALGVIDPISMEFGQLSGDWGLGGWPAKGLAVTSTGKLVSLGVCSFCMAPFEVDGISIIDIEGRTIDLITILQANAVTVQSDSQGRDRFRTYVE